MAFGMWLPAQKETDIFSHVLLPDLLGNHTWSTLVSEVGHPSTIFTTPFQTRLHSPDDTLVLIRLPAEQGRAEASWGSGFFAEVCVATQLQDGYILLQSFPVHSSLASRAMLRAAATLQGQPQFFFSILIQCFLDILTGCFIHTVSMNISWLNSTYYLSQEIMALCHSRTNSFVQTHLDLKQFVPKPSFSAAISGLGKKFISVSSPFCLLCMQSHRPYRQVKVVCSQMLQKMDLEYSKHSTE